MPVSISICDDYDGGNALFIRKQPNPFDPTVIDVVLQIKPDPFTVLENIAHMQYFSFRSTVSGVDDGVKVNYILENASKTSYPETWAGTTVCYTEDAMDVDSWRRQRDTFYTEGKLRWEFEHKKNETIYFSYFPLYTWDRHVKFLAQCKTQSNVDVTVTSLGESLEGRSIDCVKVGTGKLTCWVIHRQHPGESMAEHYAEGLLKRLLGLDRNDNNIDTATDATVTDTALAEFTFYIVPCVCPDGSVSGHLRTNSCGANLNREWADKDDYQAPTMERSPEAYCILEKMKETGCDCFLDIHGDEELPFNFLSSSHHTPTWGDRLESLHGAFCAAYCRINSDMQSAIGYPPPPNPEHTLKYMNVACNQMAARFDCLSLTLEMPFKDCMSNPDPDFGWTAARSRRLGATVLEALLYVQPYLRNDTPFWKTLPAADDYVVTTDEWRKKEEPGNGEFQMLKTHTRYYSDVHEIHKNKVK